ncbi:MAG: hypothetical protein H7Z42_17910 [Roseiflexaceae bacterium]|nr:hypothetical protein [Roseiflexaceae bacterium]
MMSRRSLLLILGLLAALVLLTAAFDALGIGGQFVPNRGGQPPVAGAGDEFPPAFLRDLPRVVGALAAVAALAGYGLLIGALAARRLGTTVRTIIGGPQQLVRLGLSGLLLAVLVVGTLLLGILAGIVGLATPAFAFVFAMLLTAGHTAVAIAAGRWLRAHAGAIEHEPIADLLTGTTALTIVSQLPYVGSVALGAAVCVGLGALAATGLGAADRWRPPPLDY